MSCDAGEDNSAVVRAYEEAEKTKKEAEDQTKLDSIGYTTHGTDAHGTIALRDHGTAGGVERHYTDSTKTHAVIYFEAVPEDGYKFSFAGLTVTTEPATTDLQYELYTAKTNYFQVKVPIETKKVVIDESNAFVTK